MYIQLYQNSLFRVWGSGLQVEVGSFDARKPWAPVAPGLQFDLDSPELSEYLPKGWGLGFRVQVPARGIYIYIYIYTPRGSYIRTLGLASHEKFGLGTLWGPCNLHVVYLVSGPGCNKTSHSSDNRGNPHKPIFVGDKPKCK